MKKLISILLTLVMVLSVFSVTAFAEVGETNGKITISPTSQNATYKVFKLFDLDTYDTASHAYSYMIAKDSPWYEFFENNATYFTIDTTEHTRGGEIYYYITATNNYTETTAVDVAKAALEYANVAANGVTATQTITETGTDGEVVFENLELGYYLVDTSVGALCGLTTTLPNAEIAVKNYPPTLTKYVKEDDIKVGNPWGVSNDAAFGELVEFDVTINARVGAHNYVFHDKMEPGLEFTEEKFVAEWAKAGEETGTVLKAGTKAQVEKNEVDVDYAIIIGDGTTCTFEVVFSENLCNALRDNDTIVLTYYAKVKAVDELDEDGIKNEAWVTYGDFITGAEASARQLSTAHAETLTYTYGFDIIKTNETGMMLPGAKFALFAKEEDAAAAMETPTEENIDKAIALEAIGTNSYRVMVEGKKGTAFTIGMDENDRTVARIIGLDDGTYYLAELAAPAGYNELAAPRAVSISDGNLFAGYKDNAYDGVSGVHIENRTGASMPTTGGTGTAMFITIGSITVIGAGVLLVTKKRMSMIEED